MTRGRLTLTFDDGFVEDYTDVWPVLRERDVAASLAITPRLLGEPGYLTADQLAELADDGWEVMAHGRRHRYLQAHDLAADAAAGDARLRVDSDHVFPAGNHAVYPGDEFEVTDGTRSERRVIADKGSDGDHPVLALETPLSIGFDFEDTVVRPTEEQLRDEIVGVMETLGDLGYDPTTFTFPYDAGDARAWRLVVDTYDALANAAVR